MATEKKAETEAKEEKRIPYTAPYVSGILEEPIYVNLEGRIFYIKRGEEVMLPPDVVNFLKEKERWKREFDAKVNREKQN